MSLGLFSDSAHNDLNLVKEESVSGRSTSKGLELREHMRSGTTGNSVNLRRLCVSVCECMYVLAWGPKLMLESRVGETVKAGPAILQPQHIKPLASPLLLNCNQLFAG